ncbi:MAG: ATP-binding cassette domain-containing protein [Pseudomonadota bacterium]
MPADAPAPATAAHTDAIRFDNVGLELGGARIYDGLDFTVKQGEFVCLLGPSGCGKSTALRLVGDLLGGYSGTVSVEGASPHEAWQKIAYVFQNPRLLPWLYALDNAAFGLEMRSPNIPKAQRREEAARQLARVGLAKDMHKSPAMLSGGERQRVAIARALALEPEIILMDEPFSALDPLIRSQMQDQLIELQAELGKTIVFITHDLDEALRIGDQIAILKDGALSQVGTPPEILLKPADDYVADFVRDVNRARVLTVNTVMKPPKARLTDENLERALDEMRRVGERYGYVVDNNRFRGIASQESLEAAISNGDGTKDLFDVAQSGPTITADAALEVALPAALEAEYPLPVVDEDGELMGVVSSREMSHVLSPPKAANEDEPVDGEPEPDQPRAATG